MTKTMRKTRKVIAGLLSILLICMAVYVYKDSAKAETQGPTVLYTHIYSPIALQAGERSGNFCADPQHPDDPRCTLHSFAFRSAEEAMSTTDVSVKEVKLTTRERDQHLKSGDLESIIINRANLTFKDHDSQEAVSGIKAVSVSGLDVVAHLEPEKGQIEAVVQIGLNASNVNLATAFVETKVYISKTTAKDDEDNSDDGSNDGSDEEIIDDGEEGIDVEDDTGDESDEAKKDKAKEDAKKAKAKAEKEMMDKATAKISARERDKEENIAVKAGKDGEASDGPSPLGIGLIALAAILAAVYGWFIRSDLRVMRWHKQKKALRGK